MADGGAKDGFTGGETNHVGDSVIVGRIRNHIHKLQATMPHLFDVDHVQLT